VSPDDLLEATRDELRAYLEGRGFAVYDHENTDDLRTAAVLDAECEQDASSPAGRATGGR